MSEELYGDDASEFSIESFDSESRVEGTMLARISLPFFLQEFAILMVRDLVSMVWISLGGSADSIASSSIVNGIRNPQNLIFWL